MHPWPLVSPYFLRSGRLCALSLYFGFIGCPGGMVVASLLWRWTSSCFGFAISHIHLIIPRGARSVSATT